MRLAATKQYWGNEARQFVAGFRPDFLLGSGRLLPAERVLLYLPHALHWTWRRGIVCPLGDVWNALAWHYGWGKHRYRIQVGALVWMHETSPEEVLAYDVWTGTVTTLTGAHDRTQCCDPIDMGEL